MKIAQRIKDARKQAGFTQQDVASRLGMSYQAISNYERGVNRIEVSILSALCQLYGVSVPDILKDELSEEGSNVVQFNNYTPTHRIPILGRISAGLPLFAEENIEGYTFTTLNGGAEYFALRVRGDSMNAAAIGDGNLIIVRRQSIVENGQVAVVLVDGQDATVKRYTRHGDIITLMPQSSNPAHMPQVYGLKETRIEILGLVVRCEVEIT